MVISGENMVKFLRDQRISDYEKMKKPDRDLANILAIIQFRKPIKERLTVNEILEVVKEKY